MTPVDENGARASVTLVLLGLFALLAIVGIFTVVLPELRTEPEAPPDGGAAEAPP